MDAPRSIGIFLSTCFCPAHLRCLLIKEQVDWHAVARRVKSHPRDVRAHPLDAGADAPRHKTILHLMVTLDPPLDALQAIIDAYPRALQVVEPFPSDSREDFFDPLGLACLCGASRQLIRTILKAKLDWYASTSRKKLTLVRTCPFTKEESRDVVPKALFARIGFHRNFFPVDTMNFLLEECPNGALTFISDRTPLAARTIFGESSTSTPDCFWEKINLVLMAATHGTVKDCELNGRTFLVLHSFLECISGLGVFHEQFSLYLCCIYGSRVSRILDLIKQRVPEQFQCRDDFGSLPLHIAVRNRRNVIDDQGPMDTSVLVVQRLMEEYPKSAGIPDAQGRLPLHVAVENGLSCIDLLVQAEPRSITTRCLVTGMYPFQLASYGLVRRGEHPSQTQVAAMVETTFRLLRLAPTTAHGLAAPREPWMDSNPTYDEIQANKNSILRHKFKIAELEVRNSKLERELEAFKSLHHCCD